MWEICYKWTYLFVYVFKIANLTISRLLSIFLQYSVTLSCLFCLKKTKKTALTYILFKSIFIFFQTIRLIIVSRYFHIYRFSNFIYLGPIWDSYIQLGITLNKLFAPILVVVFLFHS